MALTDLHRIGIKVSAAAGSAAEPTALVPVFHRWIRDGAIPDHLLIDVADYDHVPEGPGILLVGHEANFGLDDTGGRRGLLYYRKQPVAGTDLAARLRTCARVTLQACRLLERDESLAGRFRFNGGSLELFANDRLNAPNNAATSAAFRATLDDFTHTLFAGAACTIERPRDARARFGVRIAGPATSVDELLGRLG